MSKIIIKLDTGDIITDLNDVFKIGYNNIEYYNINNSFINYKNESFDLTKIYTDICILYTYYSTVYTKEGLAHNDTDYALINRTYYDCKIYAINGKTKTPNEFLKYVRKNKILYIL